MTLTVEKDGSHFGKVVLLETLAHDIFYKYDNRDNRKVSTAASSSMASITFVDGRPAIYIEAEGHGVKAASRSGATSAARFPASSTATRQGVGAESNRDPNAAYDLVSIEDTLWAHRFDVGSTFCCADSYAMNGGTSAASAARSTARSAAARPNRHGAGTRRRQDRQGRLVPRSAEGVPHADPDPELHRHLRAQPVSRERRAQRRPAVRREHDEQDGEGALASSLLGIGRAITDKG
jgi:hypothetical protein